LQREREKEPLKPGAAFEVTRRLLALNPGTGNPLVEVILLFRRGSFTSGRSVAPFVRAWSVDLFLSNDESDVRAAHTSGTAAARLGARPDVVFDVPSDEVRFAFDGDAVVFGDASDQIYAERGLDRYLEHERQNANVPMKRGPFGQTFLPKLSRLRALFMKSDGTSRVRIAIVTARNAPAHERVVRTLRAWGTPADEAHFVGPLEKAPILEATGAHIFFDDQERHFVAATEAVPSGLVPGPHSPGSPIIPSQP
jgi:5'-nucleotidase